MAIFVSDSDATGAAVAVVVGVERTGETRGGSAGIGVRDTDRLHRSERESEGFKERFMIVLEKIVLCYFLRLIGTVPIHIFWRKLNWNIFGCG